RREAAASARCASTCSTATRCATPPTGTSCPATRTPADPDGGRPPQPAGRGRGRRASAITQGKARTTRTSSKAVASVRRRRRGVGERRAMRREDVARCGAWVLTEGPEVLQPGDGAAAGVGPIIARADVASSGGASKFGLGRRKGGEIVEPLDAYHQLGGATGP